MYSALEYKIRYFFSFAFIPLGFCFVSFPSRDEQYKEILEALYIGTDHTTPRELTARFLSHETLVAHKKYGRGKSSATNLSAKLTRRHF